MQYTNLLIAFAIISCTYTATEAIDILKPVNNFIDALTPKRWRATTTTTTTTTAPEEYDKVESTESEVIEAANVTFTTEGIELVGTATPAGLNQTNHTRAMIRAPRISKCPAGHKPTGTGECRPVHSR